MGKSEIKEALLSQFKAMNAKTNDSLDPRWFMNFTQGLNSEDRGLVNPAIKEMEEEGLIRAEIRLSAQVIILTGKGYEKISQ